MLKHFDNKLFIYFISVLLGCTLITLSFFSRSLYKSNVIKPSIEMGIIRNINKDTISEVKSSLKVESGDKLPNIEDFFNDQSLVKEDTKIHYFNNNVELNEDDFSYVLSNVRYTYGVFKLYVVIECHNTTYTSYLFIEDNTSPTFILEDVVYDGTSEFDINKFVVNYKDNSNSDTFTITMDKDFEDISKENGNHVLKLTICDINNNCDVGNATLVVNIPGNPTINDKRNNSGNTTPKKEDKPSGGNTGGNGSSSKPGGNTGGNGGSTGGNTGGGTGGNTGGGNGGESHNVEPPKEEVVDLIPEVKCVIPNTVKPKDNKEILKDETVYELLCTGSKYNVGIKTYGYATYRYYSDGTKDLIGLNKISISMSGNTFNASTLQIKPEAVELYNSLGSTRDIILSKTNAYRREVGASALVIDKDLSIMATIRAIEIAYAGKFSHTRPNGNKWSTVIKEYDYSIPPLNGYMYSGENLAAGYSDDEGACVGWRNSPDHYANMIKKEFRRVGIGKYTLYGQTYTVQLFSS